MKTIIVNGIEYDAYEVTGITKAEDVANAYNFAVENNCKYYRAVSGSGKLYGWNDTFRKLIQQDLADYDGWFENKKYVEPVIEPIIEEPIEELIEETIEEIEEPVEEIKAEKIKAESVESFEDEDVMPAVESIDYKALYEETLEKLGEVEEELAQKDEEIFGLKGTIEKISTEYDNYKAEIETVKKFFRE